MSERKVISKYYPPDFDPSKVAKIKVKKSAFTKVTTMLPMSIRCNTCGEYLGRGTKFNAKKETVQEENYLGIKIYRFFIRCKKCAAELTIKTDPKNSEYICEKGATRNYEPWKETNEEKQSRLSKEQEEEQDAMIALENRTLESKREMEMLDALDEIKALNARNSEIDIEQLLEYNLQKQEQEEQLQQQEEDLLIKSIFNKDNSNNNNNNNSSENENENIKRIENDDDKFNGLFNTTINNNINNNNNSLETKVQQKTSILGNKIKVVVNKQTETTAPPPPQQPQEPINSFSSLISAYSDDEDEDEE